MRLRGRQGDGERQPMRPPSARFILLQGKNREYRRQSHDRTRRAHSCVAMPAGYAMKVVMMDFAPAAYAIVHPFVRWAAGSAMAMLLPMQGRTLYAAQTTDRP
jgi:hypothetical protein